MEVASRHCGWPLVLVKDQRAARAGWLAADAAGDDDDDDDDLCCRSFLQIFTIRTKLSRDVVCCAGRDIHFGKATGLPIICP